MSFITNSYPGTCKCGKWVLKGRGKTEPPEDRNGRWKVTCFDCMNAEEQTEHRRRSDLLTRAEQQSAARCA